jgi:hypothetical protein
MTFQGLTQKNAFGQPTDFRLLTANVDTFQDSLVCRISEILGQIRTFTFLGFKDFEYEARKRGPALFLSADTEHLNDTAPANIDYETKSIHRYLLACPSVRETNYKATEFRCRLRRNQYLIPPAAFRHNDTDS